MTFIAEFAKGVRPVNFLVVVMVSAQLKILQLIVRRVLILVVYDLDLG